MLLRRAGLSAIAGLSCLTTLSKFRERSSIVAGHAVVARATSLCSQYCPTNRREVLRSYWPFFRDDEHFAVWCQLGFSFTDGMKAGIIPNHTRTLISNVARLTEGKSHVEIF